jgi:outer membrane lipoprotein-sorting protein
MKFLNLLFVAFVTLTLVSCGERNPIVGNWKLDGVNVEKAIANFPDDQKDFARKMMSSAFDQVKGKMKLSFEKDGKFKVESPAQDGKVNTENGSWSLSADKKKLTTKVSGKEETISIIEMTDSRLVLGMSADGQGEMEMTFVH